MKLLRNNKKKLHHDNVQIHKITTKLLIQKKNPVKQVVNQIPQKKNHFLELKYKFFDNLN